METKARGKKTTDEKSEGKGSLRKLIIKFIIRIRGPKGQQEPSNPPLPCVCDDS